MVLRGLQAEEYKSLIDAFPTRAEFYKIKKRYAKFSAVFEELNTAFYKYRRKGTLSKVTDHDDLTIKFASYMSVKLIAGLVFDIATATSSVCF